MSWSSNVREGQQHDIARRAANVLKSRHFGIGAGFVDKDEALRVKIDLPFEPLLTRGIYIAAPLLGWPDDGRQVADAEHDRRQRRRAVWHALP